MKQIVLTIDFTDTDALFGVLSKVKAALESNVAPHALNGIKNLDTEYIGDSEKWWCESCGLYFDEPDREFFSGRIGRPDQWIPDEEYTYCPGCHSEDIEEV